MADIELVIKIDEDTWTLMNPFLPMTEMEHAIALGIPLPKGHGRLLDEKDILDKIRAEVEQTTSRYTISRERGAMGQVEWSDRLIKESEVLAILDKYKAESEGRK